MSEIGVPAKENREASADAMEELVENDGLPLGKQKPKDLKSDIAKVVAIIVVLAVLAYFMKHYIDVQKVKDYLHPGGSFAEQLKSYLIFVFGMGLLIALGFPRIAVCGIGGGVYGASLGILLSTLANTLKPGRSAFRKMVSCGR
ncbi:MAG: hypothetical protein ABI579_05700 [Candidatus Sumerlaeota bacterium]